MQQTPSPRWKRWGTKKKIPGLELEPEHVPGSGQLTVFERELLGRVLVQHQRKDLLLEKLFTVPTVLTAVDENVEFPAKMEKHFRLTFSI